MNGVRLILGDCLEKMATLPSASVDLVFADLPYGVTANRWDAVIPMPCLWAAYLRLVRPGAAMIFTARQPFTGLLVASQPALFKHEWIWHKNCPSGHMNAKNAPMLAHESVLVFGTGRVTYHPQLTEGHKARGTYTNRPSENYGNKTPCTYRVTSQRYPRTVQDFAVVANRSKDRLHPTQKPVDMIEYFVRTYSAPGAVVLDNCMGSGSTGVAALRAGRRFIGIEKEPAYFAIAEQRVNEALDMQERAA